MNNSANTSQSNTSARTVRAAIGFSLIVPVIAGITLNPGVYFTLSLIGMTIMFTSLIEKTTIESMTLSLVGATAVVFTMANAGNWATAADIGALSLLSIAVITTALMGMHINRRPAEAEYTATQPKLTPFESTVTNAANDNLNIAA